PHLDIIAVEMLLRDAVAGHDYNITVFEKEIICPSGSGDVASPDCKNRQNNPSVSHRSIPSLAVHEHAWMAIAKLSNGGVTDSRLNHIQPHQLRHLLQMIEPMVGNFRVIQPKFTQILQVLEMGQTDITHLGTA